MTQINGINIERNFHEFIKVSDLIYFDGPLLSHFVSPAGDDYLFYWCDVDDNFNRWIVVRTNTHIIEEYISRRITLKDVITTPIDGVLFVVDIDDNIQYRNIILTQPTNLPLEYIPNDDSYYDFEIEENDSLIGLSEKHKSGILEFHIDGKDVEYGSILLDKYSLLLPRVDAVRNAIASSFVKKHATNTIQDSQLRQSLRLCSQYKFIGSMAGSVRIILKPVDSQMTIEGMPGVADDFAQEFTGLLSCGLSKDEIISYSQKYDPILIKRFEELVEFLSEKDLSLGVNWCNAIAGVNASARIDRTEAKRILANLSDLGPEKIEVIEMTGQFYSLHTKSGKYDFETSGGDKSGGRFDEAIVAQCRNVAFDKQYTITVEREYIEKTGQKQRVLEKIIKLAEA